MVVTINSTPTIIPGIYRGEWVQSIITTPGIDKVPWQTDWTTFVQFEISNCFRPPPTINRGGGDPCAVGHSSQRFVSRIECCCAHFANRHFSTSFASHRMLEIYTHLPPVPVRFLTYTPTYLSQAPRHHLDAPRAPSLVSVAVVG